MLKRRKQAPKEINNCVMFISYIFNH